MMEVPPGRVERISDGGEEAIRAILAELRAMKFNGLLKTSVFRGDTPSQGVLVLRGGDGVLAEHRSKVDVAGAPAVPEILKDAAARGTPRSRRCGDPVPAKNPLDGIGEGPRGAGDSTAEPRRAGREGGEPRTGVRGSGGGLRRSRGVDRGTGGVSRARTSTDERFVC